MFIKLEEVLVCESNSEIPNLHLLMGLQKIKKRAPKVKNIKDKKMNTGFIFIYLRPFIKSFLLSMKTEFKLVLYSLKDPKTVQNITQNINEVFEQDLFDAYVALPNNKHTKSLSINQFMSSTENRTEDNTYVIES